MKFEIVKILAEGSYKRWMTFITSDGITYTIMIPDKVYQHLKTLKVPTSQWLRYHKKHENVR